MMSHVWDFLGYFGIFASFFFAFFPVAPDHSLSCFDSFFLVNF